MKCQVLSITLLFVIGEVVGGPFLAQLESPMVLGKVGESCDQSEMKCEKGLICQDLVNGTCVSNNCTCAQPGAVKKPGPPAPPKKPLAPKKLAVVESPPPGPTPLKKPLAPKTVAVVESPQPGPTPPEPTPSGPVGAVKKPGPSPPTKTPLAPKKVAVVEAPPPGPTPTKKPLAPKKVAVVESPPPGSTPTEPTPSGRASPASIQF